MVAAPSHSRLPENAGSESRRVQKPRHGSTERDKGLPNHDKSAWIDANYRESNPWHGRIKVALKPNREDMAKHDAALISALLIDRYRNKRQIDTTGVDDAYVLSGTNATIIAER